MPPTLTPPGPAHKRLASLIFSSAARTFLGDEDRWLWQFTIGCNSDPFTCASPLFALLSPHLQLKLTADVARWVLAGGAPDTLSVGHCAALWAARESMRAELDLEDDTAPACEAPQPRAPTPPRTGHARSLASDADLWLAQGRLEAMHEAAAVAAAEGGNLEERGLADLPPVPPMTERQLGGRAERIARLRREQAAWPPGLLGILISPVNPRPVRPPALLAPWNVHHHALVSALTEHVCALAPGRNARRTPQLAVNANHYSGRDVNFMLENGFRCIVGDLEQEALLAGACTVEQVPRLRSLKAIAARLNATFEVALAHDPGLLARASAQLAVLSLHGSFHTALASPAALRPGCEAYAKELAAWTAADAQRGIDTRAAYQHCLPSSHSLSAAALEAEGAERRAQLLRVAAAARAREGQAGVEAERELHACVAECRAGGLPSSKRAEVAVDAACGGVLAELYQGTTRDAHNWRALQHLRFERMLGEYHTAMAALHESEGGGGTLEDAYSCFATRLRAAAALRHPVAPVWLELQSPAEWLEESQEAVRTVGLRCDTCEAVKSAEELLACGACRAARYCSKDCQRAGWLGGHKALCKLLRSEE